MTGHHDTSRPGPTTHPVEAFLGTVLDELKTLIDTPTWSMDAATTTRVVTLATHVAAGITELEARSIHHAEVLGLPADTQCRDLRRWLQKTTHVTRRTAAHKVRLAASLSGHEATRTCLARGEVHAEQATAITTHLDRLVGERVSAHDQARAETFLLHEATTGTKDADDLTRLGHAIWERLDPDGADEREARALEAQEERARRRTRLSMSDDGEGLTHGRFSIPTAAAQMFRKHLHALAAPKHVRAEQGAGTYDWRTPSTEKLGHAFLDWIERTHPKDLPHIGGLAATVIAVGDYDILQGTLKAATLDTGTKISHTAYLRLACEAGIIPAWMNASGEVLALGRKHRFHTPKQRLAAIVEQHHCQHPDCDAPGYLCHTHHQIAWSQGGSTDLVTTQLLCPHHHHRAHATGNTHPMRPDPHSVPGAMRQPSGAARGAQRPEEHSSGPDTSRGVCRTVPVGLRASGREQTQRDAGQRLVLTSTSAAEGAQHLYRDLRYADSGSLMLPGEPAELFPIKELR